MKSSGTTVTFLKRSDGALLGYRANGHSGYAEAGADIVCAAVSALIQAALNGMANVVKAPVMYEVDDEKAILTACLTPECTKELLEKAQIILKTLLEAIQAIASQYPRNVRIIFKERRKYTCLS